MGNAERFLLIPGAAVIIGYDDSCGGLSEPVIFRPVEILLTDKANESSVVGTGIADDVRV